MLTADADAFVVVRLPVERLIAPLPPLMEIVPDPAFTVVPPNWEIPPEPLETLTFPAPAVVMLAPTFTPPVPPFTVRVTPPPVWPPAVVSRAALMKIPPLPEAGPPGSFAVKFSAPPRVVMAPVVATVMLLPACSVRPKLFPRLALASIASVMVMLFVAWSVTLVEFNRPTITVGSIVDAAPGSSAKPYTLARESFPTAPVRFGFVPPVTTLILRGSSKRLPASPLAPEVLTVPANPSQFLPDTSTSPPAPEPAPFELIAP